MKHLIAYGMPAFIVCLAIPMVLGMVPPNGLYGFRTSKTLSSPNIWYPVNRLSGWLLITGSALATCVNLTLWWMHPDWPEKRLLFWMANTEPVALLLGLAASFGYLRKL